MRKQVASASPDVATTSPTRMPRRPREAITRSTSITRSMLWVPDGETLLCGAFVDSGTCFLELSVMERHHLYLTMWRIWRLPSW